MQPQNPAMVSRCNTDGSSDVNAGSVERFPSNIARYPSPPIRQPFVDFQVGMPGALNLTPPLNTNFYAHVARMPRNHNLIFCNPLPVFQLDNAAHLLNLQSPIMAGQPINIASFQPIAAFNAPQSGAMPIRLSQVLQQERPFLGPHQLRFPQSLPHIRIPSDTQRGVASPPPRQSPLPAQVVSLGKRTGSGSPATRALQILDPNTLQPVPLKPPADARPSRSATPAADAFVAPVPLHRLPPPRASSIVQTVFDRHTAVELPSAPVLAPRPAARITRDESSNSMLRDLIANLRSKEGESSPSTELSEQVSLQAEEEIREPAKEIEGEETFTNVENDEASAELMGLFGGTTVKLAAAFERLMPEQEENHVSDWLPATMRGSDDEGLAVDGMANHQDDEEPFEYAEQDVPLSIEVEASSKAALLEPRFQDGKRLSRAFILSCYSNPLTKQKPVTLANSPVVLNKPIEHLLDVLRKSMEHHHVQRGAEHRHDRGSFVISRADMMGGYHHRDQFRYKPEVKLHHAAQPYIVKSAQDINEIESKIRTFRGLMNKITEGNFDRMCELMLKIEFNQLELLQEVLEVIFDKAIQEPNFVHIYARVCDLLCKNLRLKIVENDGEKIVRFKTILIQRVQSTFDARLSDNQSYAAKLKEHEETTSDVIRKRAKDELNEVVRDLKRRYMGNMKLIGQLYLLKVLRLQIISHCMSTLFESNQAEWQYESLCNLLMVIGSHLDSEDPKLLDANFSKMRSIVPSITDSRLRFMFMDLFDLRKNNWVTRKPKEAGHQVPEAPYSNRGGRPHPSGGMRHPQQQQWYGGPPSGRRQPEQFDRHGGHHLNFDSPDAFDRLAGEVRHSDRRSVDEGAPQPGRKASAPSIASQARSVAARGSADRAVAGPKAAAKKDAKEELVKFIKAKQPLKFDEFETTVEAICGSASDGPKVWAEIMADDTEVLLDDESAALRFGFALLWAVRARLLTMEAVTGLWKRIIDTSDDLSIDIPRLFENIGALLSSVFYVKNTALISRAFLNELLGSIALTPEVSRVVRRMLELACKLHSNEHVESQLKRLDFDVHKLCSESTIQDLLKMESMRYLLSGEMYMRDMYTFLCKNLSSETLSNAEIANRVQNTFKDKGSWTAKIMQPAISALLECCVDITDGSKYVIRKDLFERRCRLIGDWMVSGDDAYQLEVIQTICDFVQLKQTPFGLLQDLLTYASLNQLVSDGVFQAWRKAIHSSSGEFCSLPGSLILSADHFFGWLEANRQAISDDTGDEE